MNLQGLSPENGAASRGCTPDLGPLWYCHSRSLCLQGNDSLEEEEGLCLKMKREIGLIGGVALVSGTMIGSGIFMSPQFVLGYVGSPGASLVIWALSGVVALFGALSYTELGTIISESGGDFIYILRIYGSGPAFFAAFTFILVVKPFSIAAMAISIAEYAVAPFYTGCPPPHLIRSLNCLFMCSVIFTPTVYSQSSDDLSLC
uniref:Zmp:0000001267 n=1 Tax=Seriola lalandi dorsalis TaxID=1841481 RepID=A0A3B4XS37_SERLL